ncbi:hypothetical protein [Staphylococcus pseudoxylosus]
MDHGPDFDIACRGIANVTSMYASTKLAKRFSETI